MAGARAILVPTYYVEPFGGVNVEAQLCGTPAITSDWGGFKDTIEIGKTGYRPKTLNDWIEKTAKAVELDRDYIRQRAIDSYTLPVVGLQFQDFFQAINQRWQAKEPHKVGAGWDVLQPIRGK
jgi:glycosyltransferase involved in cell wall biosynthesis